MRTRLTTLVLLLACPAVAGDAITTNSKHVWVSQNNDYVLLEGSWRRIVGDVGSQVPTVNSVRIECYRAERACFEYVARLIDPKDDHLAPGRMLLLSRNEFAVQRWDKQTIVAKSEPRAADWFLRINLQGKAAERTSQETEARGAKGARKTPDKWILE